MNDWPLYEIFIRSKNGLNHKHVGSLHAADAHMAIQNARDVYTRRNEGISIWVVEAKNITASNPDESEALFDPAEDKIYRHPTFYKLPDALKHM
ncbi:MAG: 1,2-phenylacetyl-CoA epoxidase subunit B [Saprospiraceae bacterium]|nr:1,2-phenylacetyl-CoA epoxidase subunit B [Saprospiraceae bacterium]